jgi:hypothetical protein
MNIQRDLEEHVAALKIEVSEAKRIELAFNERMRTLKGQNDRLTSAIKTHKEKITQMLGRPGPSRWEDAKKIMKSELATHLNELTAAMKE